MRISRVAMTVLLSLALAATGTVAGCSNNESASTDNGSSSALGAQDGLEVGVQAPDFRLKNQDQGTVVLSDYLGVSNVIVVFYPLAFTPV